MNSRLVQKPPLGSQINWGHPLSQGLVGCWLMNEGGGRPRDLVTGPAIAMAGNPTWVPTAYGISSSFDGASDAYKFKSNNIFTSSSKWTVIIATIVKSGTPTNSPFPRQISKPDSSTAFFITGFDYSNHYWRMALLGAVNAVGSVSAFDPANLIGKFTVFAWSYSGNDTPQNWDAYANGIKQSVVGATGGSGYNADATNVTIGGAIATTRTCNENIVYTFLFNRSLSNSEIKSLYQAPYQFIQKPSNRFYSIPVISPTAALTGSIIGATETDIVNGGKQIVLTLTGDTWVAAGGTFDAQRANIINGLVSAQGEATGWNNLLNSIITPTNVVRSSDTVVTITLSAAAAYNITANETITATIPGSALTGGLPIVASPTFTITAVFAGVTVSHISQMATMGCG